MTLIVGERGVGGGVGDEKVVTSTDMDDGGGIASEDRLLGKQRMSPLRDLSSGQGKEGPSVPTGVQVDFEEG